MLLSHTYTGHILRINVINRWRINHNFTIRVGAAIYSAHDNTRTHTEAESFCQNINSKLATFTSQNDIDRIKNVIPDMNHRYWTGLKFTHLTGSWGFTDGTDTQFALTLITTQSYHSDQCVLIQGSGALTPTHCTEGRKIICQKNQHPVSSDPTSSSGQCEL
jgi:hypothetical protein